MDQPSPKKKHVVRNVVLVILLLIVGAAIFVFRVPQKLGLVKGAGARMTEETAERLSAKQVLAEASKKGFKAEGAKVYVFPNPDEDTGEARLYAVLDISKGFVFSKVNSYHPVVDTLVLLGGGKKAKELLITHVGLEFRDEEGKTLMTVAAKTEDIRALAEGKMTEEDFDTRIGYSLNLPNYINRSVNPF